MKFEGREQKTEGSYIGAACWIRIINCPGCNERLLRFVFVNNDAYMTDSSGSKEKIGQITVILEKIRQGNCRDCVGQVVPEYEGIIGAKEAAFCGKDDLAEGEEDKNKYPQHTWTLEEIQKGINKHTWRSIQTVNEAAIKDLKCIEFFSKEELKQTKKDYEKNKGG